MHLIRLSPAESELVCDGLFYHPNEIWDLKSCPFDHRVFSTVYTSGKERKSCLSVREHCNLQICSVWFSCNLEKSWCECQVRATVRQFGKSQRLMGNQTHLNLSSSLSLVGIRARLDGELLFLLIFGCSRDVWSTYCTRFFLCFEFQTVSSFGGWNANVGLMFLPEPHGVYL